MELKKSVSTIKVVLIVLLMIVSKVIASITSLADVVVCNFFYVHFRFIIEKKFTVSESLFLKISHRVPKFDL